ncbi:MAG: alpha/beta fold hydrolase [Saprospiraceae bacterium]|nr:alpha/beta fold hydrolase [Saprospiraceae bacterium]
MTKTTRFRLLRWRWAFLLLLPLFATGGFTFLYQAAPYMIVDPARYNFSGSPADDDLPFEKIEVRTPDGLSLRGYWVHKSADSNKTTIILLHGIGACKERWLPTAAWLWQNGYETVLLDGRAHGESDGEFCTYGFYEKYDVAAIADFVSKQKKGGKIGVWGNSLGGAIALQALAVDPRLEFGIVQSTFADFRTIVQDYQRRRLKFSWQWFTDDGIARAEQLAHFSADSIRPAAAARQIRQPILLAHGTADDRIKIEYGRQIFANLASADKTFLPVPGAGHSNLMAKGGSDYREAVLLFLARREFGY